MTSAQDTQLAIALEDSYAKAQHNGSLYQIVNRTVETLALNRQTEQSPTLVAGRQVRGYNETNRNTAPTFTQVLQYSDVTNRMFALALFSADLPTGTSIIGDSDSVAVTFTKATGNVGATGIGAGRTAGEWLYFHNTGDASIDGKPFKILAVTDDDNVIVAGAQPWTFTDATLPVASDNGGANAVVMLPSQATNGSVKRSIAMEKCLDPESAGQKHYEVSDGGIAGGFNLQATKGQQLTVAWNLLGSNRKRYPSSVGGSETPPSRTPISDAAAVVTAVEDVASSGTSVNMVVGSGSATLYKGAKIVFAGHATEYTCADDVALSTSATAVTFTPALTDAVDGDPTPEAVTISAWDYAAAETGPEMNVVLDTGFLLEGVPAANTDNRFLSRELAIALNNTLRTADNLFVFGASDVNPGTLDVTGSFNAYLDPSINWDLLTRADGFEDRAIVFSATDSTGNRYLIELPALNYTADVLSNGGKDTDVEAQFTIGGKQHGTEGITVRVIAIPANLYS